MRGPYCAGLQPDSCSHARALPGVWGAAAALSFILCATMNAPSCICQMHGLIPLISIWHQAVNHSPFTTAINHTNMQGTSAQLPCVHKLHHWNKFSQVISISPAYSQHPQHIELSKSPGIFQVFWGNCLFHYLRITPSFPRLTLSTALLYIAAYFSVGLGRNPHILECHFENLTDC